MRILLISNIYPSTQRPQGGTFIGSRVGALETRGHRVWPVAVLTRSRGVPRLLERLRGRQVEAPSALAPYDEYVVRVDLLRRLRGVADPRDPASLALAQVVTDEKIDLVHGHGMYLFPAGSIARDVASLTDVPYVVTVHGSDVNTFMRGRRAHYRGVFAGAGTVLCVSDHLARKVRAVSADARTMVVPNGYDPSTFFVGSGADDRASRVLFVGNLEPVKGADRLPRLWRGLRAARPDAELDIVGSGSLATRLRPLMPGARFHGQVSPVEVATRMRSADVLVLPSRSEGWPTVITEAYACGLPVVGYDVGGVAEAIQFPDHVVPPGRGLAAFCRTVVRVLDERGPRHEIAALVRGRTWAAVARREERILDEVLRSRRAAGGEVGHR